MSYGRLLASSSASTVALRSDSMQDILMSCLSQPCEHSTPRIREYKSVKTITGWRGGATDTRWHEGKHSEREALFLTAGR